MILADLMMGATPIGSVTLAAVSAVDSYRRGMYGPPPEGQNHTVAFVIGGLVLALVWAGVYLFDRRSKRKAAATKVDRSLFGDLCSSHGLNAEERTYLEAVAKQKQVDPPVAIFVRPEVIEPLKGGPQGAMWTTIAGKVYGQWQ